VVHSNVVTVEQMQEQLHSVDWARQKLAETEPLFEYVFTTGNVKLVLEDADAEGKPWFERELTGVAPAYLEVGDGGDRFQLTRQALMETASVCHIPRAYQVEIPPSLLAQNINWWLSTGLGERDLKMLSSENIPVATPATPWPEPGWLARAVCRATISPFSNLALMDRMLAGLEQQYGKGEVLVDYKFHHDLEATAMRLIVPGKQRVISGTPVADDTWSTGLQLKNSLIGLTQTQLDGYLFRWWCTNGSIDTLATSGGFARRGASEDDALAWAAESVEEILGGLEHTLDEVQEMTSMPVTGDVTTVLGDLFREHGLPGRDQSRVIAAMADTEDMTMYGLMQAVTQAANLDDLPQRSVEALLRMGGHLVRAASAGRCSKDAPCRRILPDGWEVTHPVAPVPVAQP
jgi:hypothetical protein